MNLYTIMNFGLPTPFYDSYLKQTIKIGFLYKSARTCKKKQHILENSLFSFTMLQGHDLENFISFPSDVQFSSCVKDNFRIDATVMLDIQVAHHWSLCVESNK